ncbi:MAG: glycosyltransferase family 2 protein [Bacteroidales bacterium]|nr:glycosyltransferase family 2 protein [Bacteroidales bacterium]
MDTLNIITLGIVTFLILRLCVLVYNYLTKPLLTEAPGTSDKLVSILIPARNEEQNIGLLLSDLVNQDYLKTEILVYDDLSEDATATIVEEYANRDSRIRLLRGTRLPEGWLGKNHACYRLAIEARGQYFLFIDADVRLHRSAISSALSYTEKRALHALSVFPTQIMLTRGERALVPLMLWVLLTLLPLRMVEKSRYSSLAAANGQFYLHEAAQYLKFQWHKRYRNHRVEDVAIARALKSEGLRMATLLGNTLVNCRMYKSYTDALQGFSKNFRFFFGNNLVLMYVFILVSTFGWLLPLVSWSWYFSVPFIGVLVLQRCMLAKLTNGNCKQTLLDTPLQQAALIHLALRIGLTSSRGGLQWKGRHLTEY